MKTNNLKNIALISLVLAGACKQDVITLQQPVTPPVPTYTKGDANFTKYVAIGNSLTAGYQAGALFTEGQENSFPKILSKQFAHVGGDSVNFFQPDINSVNGYNSSNSDPANGIILGRLILFAADGIQADARPVPSGYPGVPAPYNTADLPGPYLGGKPLNNFGVPGILLGQVLTPLTGGPSTNNPAYNPLYARFAASPGTSTIIGEAIAAQPTFFTFDLGNNDVLGYATTGGNGSIPLTDPGTFQGYYGAAIGALLNPNTNPNNPKGAVSTIPDVTTIPFFYTVAWNAIPMDTTTATAVTTQLGVNYNGFLDAMVGAGVISSSEAAKRKLSYHVGENAILISDGDLTNLAPYMQGPAAGLAPYALARQTTKTDLIPLTAGAVLGTSPGGNPANGVYGVSIPLDDKYALVPSEIDSITTATNAFNDAIKAVAAQYPTQIAVADVNQEFKNLFAARFAVSDGVTITPDFTPPTGAFSEDGVHPNSRGYAYLANIFIKAIDAKFNAVIPLASLARYKGVGLPLLP